MVNEPLRQVVADCGRFELNQPVTPYCWLFERYIVADCWLFEGQIIANCWLFEG